MSTTTRIAALVGTAALTAGGLGLAVAAPAHADVERNGTCGGAQFDFTVDRDDDRRGIYEVNVDLDNARPGTTYQVVLRQNGKTFVDTTRRADREGDVEVERNRPNTAGRDTFVLRYTNTATDRTCRQVIRVA